MVTYCHVATGKWRVAAQIWRSVIQLIEVWISDVLQYYNCIFVVSQANHYYKLFITWTNQKIRSTFVQRNMFEFKHIKVSVQG